MYMLGKVRRGIFFRGLWQINFSFPASDILSRGENFMGKHIVQLSDANGLSCRVRLSLPYLQNGTDPYNSAWKVLDEGFLKIRSGGCHMVDTEPGKTFTDGNLLLCSGKYHGVNLYSFV